MPLLSIPAVATMRETLDADRERLLAAVGSLPDVACLDSYHGEIHPRSMRWAQENPCPTCNAGAGGNGLIPHPVKVAVEAAELEDYFHSYGLGEPSVSQRLIPVVLGNPRSEAEACGRLLRVVEVSRPTKAGTLYGIDWDDFRWLVYSLDYPGAIAALAALVESLVAQNSPVDAPSEPVEPS